MSGNDDDPTTELDERIRDLEEELENVKRRRRFAQLKEELGATPPRKWRCPRCHSSDLTMYVPVWATGAVDQPSTAESPVMDEVIDYCEIEDRAVEYSCAVCDLFFPAPDRVDFERF